MFKTLVGVEFLGNLAVVEALCVFVVDVDRVVFLVCVTLELSFEDTKVESGEVWKLGVLVVDVRYETFIEASDVVNRVGVDILDEPRSVVCLGDGAKVVVNVMDVEASVVLLQFLQFIGTVCGVAALVIISVGEVVRISVVLISRVWCSDDITVE